MGTTMKTSFFLVLVALFWSGFTLIFDFTVARDTFHQVCAGSYPTVSGTITDSQIETVADKDGSSYRPKIGFKYVVADHEYRGERYRYGKWSSSDQTAAHRRCLSRGEASTSLLCA